MYYFCPKMLSFLQKNPDISKINGAMVVKGIFFETPFMCVLSCRISSF